MESPTLAQPAQDTAPLRLPLPPPWLLWPLTPVVAALLVWAAFYDIQDVNGYHCYALAFWGGRRAVSVLPTASVPFPYGACLVPVTALPLAPFHALPAEYGPLALLAFLPPLLVPTTWYNFAFFVEMALVVVALTWLLARYGAPGAGYLWLTYAMLGSMTLAAGRFDVLPATCVVIAIIAAQRGKLPLAYGALALGTLLKLYPAALLPLLLIESWRARDRAPLWHGPALFAGLVAVGEGLAATRSPTSLLSPFSFMSARCAQVESLPASLGYLWAQVTRAPLTYPYDFNSTCLQTPSLPAAEMITLALGMATLALAITLSWRRRLTLGQAALLVIAALILGSKVFSPQYLLWLSPLVALEYGADLAALLGWSIVCLITTFSFPFSYDGTLSQFFDQPSVTMISVTSTARNLALLALGGVMLWRHARAARQDDPASGGSRNA